MGVMLPDGRLFRLKKIRTQKMSIAEKIGGCKIKKNNNISVCFFFDYFYRKWAEIYSQRKLFCLHSI
jgi:hypothetical protein